MLPDFPALKEKLQRRHLLRCRAEEKGALGIFGKAQEVMMFEGRGTETTQDDGHQEKSDRYEGEAKFEFSKDSWSL